MCGLVLKWAIIRRYSLGAVMAKKKADKKPKMRKPTAGPTRIIKDKKRKESEKRPKHRELVKEDYNT